MLFAGGRQWVCSKAAGEVLEIGVGTGRNFEHYPPGIRLTGIDLSEPMLEAARSRATQFARDVDLPVGDAQALEFPDNSFDSVVSTLTLCSVPDDRAVVREVKRVLRPGRRFVSFEQMASPIRAVRLVQSVLDWLTVRAEGDHLTREPLRHLQAQGFDVEVVDRLKWGIVERIVARKATG